MSSPHLSSILFVSLKLGIHLAYMQTLLKLFLPLKLRGSAFHLVGYLRITIGGKLNRQGQWEVKARLALQLGSLGSLSGLWRASSRITGRAHATQKCTPAPLSAPLPHNPPTVHSCSPLGLLSNFPPPLAYFQRFACYPVVVLSAA